MIVYHGTANTSFESIRDNGLRVRTQAHVLRDCVCTTTDFKVAARFAMRKTPSADFLKLKKITGIVL